MRHLIDEILFNKYRRQQDKYLILKPMKVKKLRCINFITHKILV